MNKDYRFYQLTFCSVCKLRDLTSNKGIVCSLTNDIAQFEKECPDYDFDDLELAKIKKEIAQKIEKNYFEKKSNILISGYSYFTKKEDIKTLTNFSKKENTYNKTYKEIDNSWSIVAIFGSLLFISTQLSFLTPKLLYISLVCLLLGPIIYYNESKKIKKIIITMKDGFLYGSTKIYYNEIIDYGVSTIPNDNKYPEETHLFTMNRGTIIIKTYNYVNLGSSKMIEILNYNKSDLAN